MKPRPTELAEAASHAAVAAMRESWRMRLDAADTLLEAAERALDRAEAAAIDFGRAAPATLAI